MEQLKNGVSTSGGDHPTASTSNWEKVCKRFEGHGRAFGRGMQGDDVREVQWFLIDSGDLDDKSDTGYFGEKTEKAVKEWQRREGVVSTGDVNSTGWGKVGVRTRAAMFKRCRDHTPNVPDENHVG